MDWLEKAAEVQGWVAAAGTRGETLALVPTMGYLHRGHAALMDEARRRADKVVVSVFVNPTQFGPQEDLSRYPRDLEGDRALCLRQGVDAVFVPAVEDIYPPGFATFIEVGGLGEHLCGQSRPGHFRGVATVVARLFGLVKPDLAVFGEKDFQQLAILRRMTHDLLLGVEIVGVPTVREGDGLALSSRNVYLTREERERAVGLFRALEEVSRRFDAGERDPLALEDVARKVVLAHHPTVIDYIRCLDAENIQPVPSPIRRAVVLAMAVKWGTTRLIDNRVLSPS